MIPRLNFGASAVGALLRNEAALKEFPFLKDAPKVLTSGGCGGCGAKRTSRGPDVNWIKQRIAGLAGAQKNRLKVLLNAKSISGSYRQGGRLIPFNF